MKYEVTQSDLRDLFTYDPITGLFTSIKRNKVMGTINAIGYVVFGVKRKTYLAHRMAWLYMHGYLPKLIDHIDGNRQNNSMSNLRECTQQENLRNVGHNSRNKLGVKGISILNSGKYMAQIRYKNKNLNLGTYDDLEDAKDFYGLVASEIHGEFKYMEVA